MSNDDTKYFDLYTTGIGYLNRVRGDARKALPSGCHHRRPEG